MGILVVAVLATLVGFALILLIANAVQNAMVGSDTSLLGGLAAAAVLLVLNYGLGAVAARTSRPRVRQLVTKSASWISFVPRARPDEGRRLRPSASS